MSLVILKVDRDNKTCSIYSEGITCSGHEIVNTDSVKIKHIKISKDYGNYDILIGCVGGAMLNVYVRSHFQTLIETIISNHNTSVYSDELIMEIMIKFRSMIDEYIAFNGTKDEISFGCVFSINGSLFKVEQYDKSELSCVMITDKNYVCVGQEHVAAQCLIHNNIDINKVFKTISRFNNAVNDKMDYITINYE